MNTNVDEEDFEIVGLVPGHIGKVFTILALPESGSFTDPECDPLLARIQYSSEETAAAGLLNQQAPDGVEKRSGGRRRWKWKKMLVCLCLWMAYSLCTAAFSIVNPFFPQTAEKKGASPIVIGIIISCSPLSVVVSSPIIGYMMHGYIWMSKSLLHYLVYQYTWSSLYQLPYVGVWPQVLLGLLLIGCSYISLGFVNLIPNEWSFVLSCIVLRLLEGLGTAVLNTAIFSTFPKLFPKSVATLVGLFELGGGVGYSLGPAAGGALYEYGGYRLPFVAVGGSILILVLPCTLLVKKLNGEYKRKTLSSRSICKLLTNFLFIVLLMTMILAYNTSAYFAPGLPSYMKTRFDQSPFQIGLVYFIGGFTYLIIAVPIGPLIDKVGHHSHFIVCGLLGQSLFQFMFGILNAYTEYQSVWVVRFTYAGFAVVAFTVIPIYAELLKIGEKCMRPDDSKAALSSFVSGLITSASNLSLAIGTIFGGTLTTFMSVPMSAVIAAEAFGSQALLLAGVYLISNYTKPK